MNKRLLSPPAAVLMVLSILAVPVVAGTIRTEYEGMEYYVRPVPPGRQ